jgi:MFS transporter, ACS family, tartrate transporter
MTPAATHPAVVKVLRRLLPCTMLLLLFNLIDRTNISFAALQMNADLGFDSTVYGAAAGIFFLGYCLFEVPSNLVLARVGARPWLARILVSWAVVVILLAFTRSAASFYTLRFLLGVAEAGLLPGVMLYLARWVPAHHLGIAFSLLYATTALANVLSGPVAGLLMHADGSFGLRGWQLMFIAEGAGTVLAGLAVIAFMPERIADATFLDAAERTWLAETLAHEEQEKAAHGATALLAGFLDRRVLVATLVCFLFLSCNFGTVFWLPQIIQSLGVASPLHIGLLTAVPYLLGGAATILWGRHSDASGERKWHLTGGALLGMAGYACAAAAPLPQATFAGLCIGTLGIWSTFGVFWAYCGRLLGGAAAVGGLAFINSISSLGGFVAPLLMGVVKQRTQSFTGGLLVLTAFALATALASLLIEGGRQPAAAAPARAA